MILFLQRFAVLLLLLVVPTIGQSQDKDQARTEVSAAPAAVRRYEPGAWSTLAVNGTNRTDSDTNEFISVYVGENSHLQFARRFWLPAGTRRKTYLPILIPHDAANPQRLGESSPQIDAFVMRLNEQDGAETFENNLTDEHIVSQPLLLDFLQTKTGIIFHRAMPDETGMTPDVDWAAYEAVYKARESAVSSRVLIDFGIDFLPGFPTTLDSLDQMVISGDRILKDTAGLANLRHWLQRGGRIWIMLDSTSMETVTALMGNDARCSIVDRIELNEFEIEDVGDIHALSDEPAVETFSSEIPVELLRVFAETDDIHCRIDGWPVAFWQKVGDGEVLFTTLAPRAWVDSGRATPALASVARRFFQPREEVVLEPEVMGPLLNDQIGYRIPSRRLATFILGLNSLAVLSFGCWWARQRQLERLAWFIPVVALLSAVAFLAIGSRNTVAVPSTVAIGQIVRVSAATNESHISAVSAIYSQESGDVELAADSGSQATVSSQEGRGAIKRIVWDDNGQARWSNLHQPSGVVRYIESKRTVADGTARMARGTFDATGFHGTLVGVDAGDCEDALIVAVPAPASAVSLNSDGAFQLEANDVLARGQYVADGLVSDKQRSRQDLLRKLLSSTALNTFGTEPSLLVWTPLLDMGVEFDPDFDHLGSALLSIPLQIERPAAGTDVQVPATFIRLQSFTGRQGSSTVFNQRTGEWFKNANKPTRSQLRCIFPQAVVPMQVTEATVTIKINAPSRTLKIEGIVNGKPTMLHQKHDPIGVLRFDIKRPEALELDAGGGLHLSIVITETERERDIRAGREAPEAGQFDNNTWWIDYVRVDARGTVR